MEHPQLHIHHPEANHTHTAILLHGRGSDGPEFAEELFSSTTSREKNLTACLPGWRWVFPTAGDRWSTTFQEEMCTWFDAYSLGDIQEKQELQADGIKESATYILDILENEIALLGGKHTHVYIGGISQGMATTIWTFLGAVATGRIQGPLGGVLGFCGWFPYAQQLGDLVQKSDLSDGVGSPQMQRLLSGFFFDTLFHKAPQPSQPPDTSVMSTPVFLSHGTDDDWVSVELGRQASRVLRKALLHVEWNEFTGAEGDGHWIKEPEGFDQILQFLERPPQKS
ncbi:uncharacterized protein PFLUO_LOCUS1862 [Penicillium psychrofluorescens]|uniref:uncharacterized protein n=1 Tax=Penicillium psychrofluorescens TaxID=3158075 RepID=UPI003CCE1AFC